MISKLPFFLAAFGIGLLLAAQPVVNAQVARTSGEPLMAASVSLFVSLALVLPLALALKTGSGGFGWVAKVPWWAWFGGLAGVGFVAGGLLIAPAVGVVAFVAFVLFGQVVGAVLIDQFGIFNAAVRPLGWERAIALGLVLAGAVLFLRAPG